MKLMIASDIHGSAFYCEKMIEAYKREGADRLLLLGDILYHGPRNDLPEGYAPKAVIAMLNPMKKELLCVRGNCDTEVDQMVLSNTLTDSTMCKQDQANIYGAQGAFYDLKPLIDEYAPHIKAYLDANPDYESLVTNEDGSIYGLLVEGIQKGSFILTRQVWMYPESRLWMILQKHCVL